MSNAIERESEKLLHVAELLERDSFAYKVPPDEYSCWRCSLYARRSRVFGAMAKRIRRFWGAAVQIVPDDRVRELIESKIRLLNGCKGRIYPCDPMSEMAALRELLALRQENRRLKQCAPDRLDLGHELVLPERARSDHR